MPEKLTHAPDHHNGDCIYCRGFSYDDPWWNEICQSRVVFERREVLNRPEVIRGKIAQLERELKEAERAAAALTGIIL